MMSSERQAPAPNRASAVPAATVTVTATNTVTNADALQKAKRPRQSKPKVKTGCHNCKLRRIKCDEKRPACSNCIRSKKVCTGYPPPPRSARPFEEIKIAPKPAVVESNPPPGREPIRLPPRRVAKYQRRSTPPTTPTPTTPQDMMVMLHRPSVCLPFNEQESLYFQLFQEHTASELSGFFDSAFWTRSVLRECHSEDSIRHAVVALGALYKTLEKSTESPPGSPSDKNHDPADHALRHWEMAVKKYSHACTSLVLVNSADTRSHRTRLMASVLLACFDSFIGDHKQAIVQIQNGLGLLSQLRAERRRAFAPQPEEPVEEELVQMFTRLAIQAKSYDMAFHFPHPYVVRLTGQPQTGGTQDAHSPSSDGTSPISSPASPDPSSLPARFDSILEARVAWDKLCERIFKFTETMFTHTQNRVMGVLPPSLQQYGVRFKREIEMWSDAFEPTLQSRIGPGISSQAKAGIAVLKMSQIMAQILFLMTFSDNEMQFDAFTPQFRAIVELATEVVGDEERRAAAKRCPDPMFCPHLRGNAQSDPFGSEYTARHIKPSFSADMGIVPPLFVVATKCRNPPIRRQAIQLLRSSSRREAMWDSELTARIAMWIAEIEEADEAAAQQHLTSAAAAVGRVGSEDGALLTPFGSPVPNLSRPSTSTSSSGPGSIDLSGSALGPGGNARWNNTRRELQISHPVFSGRQQQQQPHAKVIPEERRVMVRAVEFDLRERYAVVQLGTRGLPSGTPDLKTQSKRIVW